MIDHPEIRDAIRRALEEDIGPGDVTTAACVPETQMASGRFLAKERQVIAGIELLPLIYGERGSVGELLLLTASGQFVEAGETLALVAGRARTLLECERVALNFLQRLSGIATLARQFVDRVQGTNCRVLDTRKTTPGLRRLEKFAAAAGGITNHRMGLYDAVLIKNNHIAAAGGVSKAIERVLSLPSRDPEGAVIPVEVEVRTRAELEEALAAGATHILLDNLTPVEAAIEVRWIAGRATVELSGGVDLENVRAFAETGADFVSSGAITHSARATDISFRLELK